MTSTAFSDKPGCRLGNIFIWQFRRALPVTAIYCAVSVGICLFPPYDGYTAGQITWQSMVILAFAVLLPALHFGACFGRPQADFFHAMPVKRGAFFLGSLLASLASLWLPLVPGMEVKALLSMFSPDGVYSELAKPVPILVTLAVEGAAVLLFFTLAAVASGTYLEYGLTALVLAGGWPLMLTYLDYMISGTASWMRFDSQKLWFLRHAGSPPVALFFSFQQEGIGPMLVWMGVFALLLAGAGYLVYCRRHSEDLGIAGRCRGMELFLRVEAAVAMAIFVGDGMCCITYDRLSGDKGIPLTLGAMALALAGVWLFTELLYRRSLKRLHRHWKPLALSAGIMAVLLGVISTGMGMDTCALSGDDVLGVSLSPLQEYMDIYRDPCWVSDPDDPDKYGATLYPGAVSPESLEKVRALCKKWTELERASQYPYLPGRASYRLDGEMSLYIRSADRNARASYVYRHASKPTPRSQELMEVCVALQWEILTSEEYVESLLPLNALEAMTQVDKEDGEWVLETDSVPAENAQRVSAFPQGFMEQLEQALREDFSSGRFSTLSGLEQYKGEVYRLCYQRREPFTAKAGILTQADGSMAESAAGKRLTYTATDWVLFSVTPEMTATHQLLERTYK